MRLPRIIRTEGPIAPDRPYEIRRYVSFLETRRVRGPEGPVDPSDTPVRVLRSMEHVQVGWDVVLVGVTSRLAELPEKGVVLGL